MAEVNDQQPPAPLQVLLLVDDDTFSRLGGIVRNLCVGMMDEPVRLTVLCRETRCVPLDSLGPARTVHVPPRRFPWPRTDPDDLLALIGGERPDVVHCLSGLQALWFARYLVEWECPLVVHLTDLLDVRHFRRLPVSERVVAVAATTRIESALLEADRAIAPRIRQIPLGIPARQEPVCLIRPERVPAVVVTAPLTKICGLEVVLPALRSVIQGGQETQLFLLGTGPCENRVRRLVQKLDLRAYVTFAGPFPDWNTFSEAMRGGDIYLKPPGGRRFTISALTAMAAGMAILAPTDTPEDYLVDGTTATLFDPRQPKRLADKWTALLEDREMTRQLAHGALDYVRTYHQASRMVSSLAEVYRELAGTPVEATP